MRARGKSPRPVKLALGLATAVVTVAVLEAGSYCFGRHDFLGEPMIVLNSPDWDQTRVRDPQLFWRRSGARGRGKPWP